MQNEIVIIEDDESIRETLKMKFEFEGFKVHTANNGKEGLELLAQFPHPCTIILDLMMPVMDGLQFLHSFENKNYIPVVLTTAFPEKAEGEPISHILQKPFNLKALVEIVKQHCECHFSRQDIG